MHININGVTSLVCVAYMCLKSRGDNNYAPSFSCFDNDKLNYLLEDIVIIYASVSSAIVIDTLFGNGTFVRL